MGEKRGKDFGDQSHRQTAMKRKGGEELRSSGKYGTTSMWEA